MSLPERTAILIVGAGPSGVATALSLIHHGCRDFVVVDAMLQGQNSSRAVVIHAATLESLDVIGCADDLIARGWRSNTFALCNRTSNLFSVGFSALYKYTRFPYALVISQTTTELILENKLKSLGVSVIRPCKVTGMQCNKHDNAITDVVFEGGRVIEARYVIGADGARSTVRSIAGIGFGDPNAIDSGPTHTSMLSQMVIADVYFTDETALPNPGAVSMVMSSESILVVCPIPSDNDAPKGMLYRIACGVPVEMDVPLHAPHKEYLQGLIKKLGPRSANPPSSLEISEVAWSTRFRTHSAIADTFFKRLCSDTGSGGGILLVGDAAHIHSPAGGQGMNLGLRDAVAMGEAMSAHLNASRSNSYVDDHILRAFADNRHANSPPGYCADKEDSWILRPSKASSLEQAHVVVPFDTGYGS